MKISAKKKNTGNTLEEKVLRLRELMFEETLQQYRDEMTKLLTTVNKHLAIIEQDMRVMEIIKLNRNEKNNVISSPGGGDADGVQRGTLVHETPPPANE